MSKLVGNADVDDDAPSVDIAKSQNQLPDNNTGIKSKLFNSFHVHDLACFAVDQHNLKKNANLKFLEVLYMKWILVAGLLYHIILEAKDGEKVLLDTQSDIVHTSGRSKIPIHPANMKIIAAYLLAVLGGNASPSAADIKNILGSVGVEGEDSNIELLLSVVKGKDFAELIASGREKEESDDDMGFSLFD
ncbi:60S acidic ribosomal protein P2B-like [Trifolium medium]|uniref:60S acidic ribosomal protein P2B-like n=2 Tax=Trifolium medium TaxID=97028 RepID=A0A392M7N7_9FABA|nr:60S acidic ribosomal protein P2B-like [Trifolium medium]